MPLDLYKVAFGTYLLPFHFSHIQATHPDNSLVPIHRNSSDLKAKMQLISALVGGMWPLSSL